MVGWHPALWWIDRRLHVEREIACDEMTVAITGSPKTYAECLVKLASLKAHCANDAGRARCVHVFRSARARHRRSFQRIRRSHRLWSRSIAVAIVTLLCLMSMGLGGLNLVEATVLALPIVSSLTLSSTAHPIASIAVPILPSDTADGSRRFER